MNSPSSIPDLPDWVNQEPADDEWIYDWATTINDPPRVEDPIEILLRESMALEPSMFDQEVSQPSSSTRPPQTMSATLQASQALTTIVEDPAENISSASEQETTACNCCTEIASLRGEMKLILHEMRGLRQLMNRDAQLENRVDVVEELSIQYMDAVRESIAILQADRSKAEEWMYQYQRWSETTHGAVQNLMSQSGQAALVGMTPEETTE